MADAVPALFLSDPAAFFGGSLTRMMGLPREQVDALQLAALRARFAALRDAVPVLTKLADREKVGALERLDDVAPLLFQHTTYKSYPIRLLEQNRFDQLTRWLDKLTAHDLSSVDASGCGSIDAWMDLLDEKTPLRVLHSSGTSGTMSFLPHSKAQHRAWGPCYPVVSCQTWGEEPRPDQIRPNVHTIYPHFRSGGSAQLRWVDLQLEFIAGSEERLHTLYPGRMSSDLLFLAGRLRAAAARGELDRFQLPEHLSGRRKEFEAIQRDMPQRIQRFFAEVIEKFAGQRVWIGGSPPLLYKIVEANRGRGLSRVFSPDSVVYQGGGNKGEVVPKDWQAQVEEFFGCPVGSGYGMSEFAGGFPMCRHGSYHAIPTVILFVLDPDTGVPLPRSGVQTGRAGFFDLLADAHWGGFISGDEITVDWNGGCACGQPTPALSPDIQRYSEKRGGDDKISCSATPEAIEEALAFLNDFKG